MRWDVHGERSIYTSEWVSLTLVDVEIPAIGDRPSRRFEHHVVRSPAPAAGVVVIDEIDGVDHVLLLWRHRFITDTWGWEVPAGGLDPGEASVDGARREVLEETGRQVGELTHLVDYYPANGLSDHRFDLYLARGASHVGEPSDPSESERIEWVPLEVVRDAVVSGRITDGLSVTALVWYFAFGDPSGGIIPDPAE